MRTSLPLASLASLALALALGGAGGCVFDIPVNLGVAAAPIDLDAARVAFESRVCANADSADCAVLDSLDRVDGARETPAALPALFPEHINVDSLQSNVDVQRWFGEQQLPVEAEADLGINRLVPMTLPNSVNDEMITDLQVETAAVHITGNTLSVDLPRFDVYVGNGYGQDDDGNVIGSTDDDGGEFVAVTDRDDGGPLYFREGGVAAVREALLGDEPWVELRPQSVFALRKAEEALLRPGGRADVSVDIRLVVPVAVEARPVVAGQDVQTP